MKKIFLAIALIATIWIKPGFAQSNQTKALLTAYYDIKNALINADAGLAASKAGTFVKLLDSVPAKAMPEAESAAFMALKDKLALDAGNISATKEISRQREYFANFSTNLFKLAKVVKLTGEPVYYVFCPMKKSYWLAEYAAIKNPYFGKQMLTCGTVKEILK